MDYSYQKVDYAEVIFYGKLTNETRVLNKEECKEKRIFSVEKNIFWAVSSAG